MDIKLIADRIKYARSLRNLTLDDIAEDIGVAKSTVQRYEKGLIASPKLPVLQSIAKSLNVNPMWLSGKSDSIEPEDPLMKYATEMEVNQRFYNLPTEEKEKILDLIPNESEEHYYFNEDARELAEFMFKNPEYKVLFDASRKVKKEDIDFVRQMIDRVRGDDNDTGC